MSDLSDIEEAQLADSKGRPEQQHPSTSTPGTAEGLAEACGYDENEDTGIDSLIDYKNALEDHAGTVDAAIAAIEGLRDAAEKVMHADNEKWERLACGQDSEEAEATGVLAGQVGGLEAALDVLRGESGEQHLDLYIEENNDA